ncbi:MAG TPA: glycoside hydrolase family 3 C-terminal domain-containing protein [Actinophytocola sp.]|uniref:glycoside hydrolase family 3 protein n=1 Tax=Actinophytocola sp. TaxID=1872138 RepID=UPI002DDCED43|nr:glycoside hydrolase family 3 C-terminal domain-containing protein [Actinophytocola sp.]HEV2779949.1 glycoside hydrolase family 3 C-terminal domain-containing protein [Actinophytocola sp.]
MRKRRVPAHHRRLGVLAVSVALMVSTTGPLAAADQPQAYPFNDTGLALNVRVDDLLRRLTLDEKISLLHQFQPAIPRLGIPEFKAGTEALHGLAWTTDRNNNGAVVTANATVFPQAIGLASTWDPALIKRVGSVVGDEARGYNSEAPGVWGVQLWAPVVNLLRDPRWGRNEEGYSEDPLLTGKISTAYGAGLTGDHPTYLKTAPVLKHYLANNNEIRRDTTSSNLRPRVKHEYDEPAFKAAISADAATGVMGAYNLVNGRPNTVNPDFNDVVRTWTDKTLYNVSDAFAPYNLTGSEQYYATNPEGFAATLKAGLDSFTVDNQNSAPTIEHIKAALAQGLLTEADIDTAVRHVLSVRMRLGDFDPDGGPYAGITKDVVNSPAHRALARTVAGEAMVLLKNTGALPLNPARARNVAVIGPLEKTLYTDWYSGSLPYRVTPLDGIKERLGAGATVADTEAVDRIALRDVASGRYVTAGSDVDGEVLRASGTSAGATEQFDVFDWGQGVLTLRSVANDRYVERQDFGATSPFVNRAPQPRDWFVQQQFKLEDAGDGTFVIRYAGFETPNDWEGPNNYVTVTADGTLTLGSPDAAGAARFTKETLSRGIDGAVQAATGADAAIVVVGSMPFINGREDHDRTTMALAESQSELIRAVHRANPNTIVVVENSYPTTLTWEQQNIPAILWTTHAGQETGHAVADVLFGDVNPAGRLTQTWYRSDADLPSILEYDIIKTDRTYQYFRGDPLYPFGHGLSYTSFRYSDLRVSQATVRPHGTVEVSVRVTNTGRRAGDEVVQLYTHQRSSRDKQPVQQLRAFQRVHLEPGQTRTVRLSLAAQDLAHWDVTRSRWVVEQSVHDVLVGASAGDIRQRAAVRVDGEQIPSRNLGKETRAIDFDDYSGVDLVDESKVRGDAVGASAGDWVKFTDTDLRAGARGFTARVARAAAGSASIEVRLDDPVNGRLVGTIPVPSTGDKYAYTTTTGRLTGASGRHDVYLVFTGDLRISTFSLR